MKLYIVTTKDGPTLIDGDGGALGYVRAGYHVERITETKTMTLVGSKIEEMCAEILRIDSAQKRSGGHG